MDQQVSESAQPAGFGLVRGSSRWPKFDLPTRAAIWPKVAPRAGQNARPQAAKHPNCAQLYQTAQSETSQHQARRHCRRQPEAHAGPNMDNNIALPGEFWFRLFLAVSSFPAFQLSSFLAFALARVCVYS